MRSHHNTNPVIRLLSLLYRGMTRTPAIYLSTTLKHNGTRMHPFAFAAWLAAAAQHHGTGTS